MRTQGILNRRGRLIGEDRRLLQLEGEKPAQIWDSDHTRELELQALGDNRNWMRL